MERFDHGSNGTIGTDLLKALEREWGCKLLIKDALQTTAALPFDQLAATIESSPTQTQIRGRCPGQTAGVLLSSGGHAVLNEPTRFGGPAAQMLAVLVPANTPQVPALPSLASWLRWLPEPTPGKTRERSGNNRDEQVGRDHCLGHLVAEVVRLQRIDDQAASSEVLRPQLHS